TTTASDTTAGWRRISERMPSRAVWRSAGTEAIVTMLAANVTPSANQPAREPDMSATVTITSITVKSTTAPRRVAAPRVAATGTASRTTIVSAADGLP